MSSSVNMMRRTPSAFTGVLCEVAPAAPRCADLVQLEPTDRPTDGVFPCEGCARQPGLEEARTGSRHNLEGWLEPVLC